MKHINLISVKSTLAELNVDYNINDSGLLSQVPRHVARALELMELDGYFQLTYCKKKTVEGRLSLPCDNKYLMAALVLENGGVSKIDLYTRLSDNNAFAGIPYSDKLAKIDRNYLISGEEDKELTIGFIYYSMPLDDEGMPLVPDNPFVLDAIPFYVISKLSLGGYKHPIITYELADAKWERKYPQARNNVNYPSIEEMIRYTEYNTNPYFDRILNLMTFEQEVDAKPVFLSKELI